MSDRTDETDVKTLSALIFLLILAGAAPAAPDPHDAQVDAAVGDAVERMRADIEVQRLSPDLSIADFLKQTGSGDRFDQTLHKADQIGGPRWIDNETCQVKLAIGSDRVRQTLIDIAQESGRTSPLPPDAMAAKLRIWDNRTFTAMGTSISAKRAELIRPAAFAAPWRQVPDDVRRQTICAARDNAVDRVLDSIGSVDVSEGKTVSTILSDKSLQSVMREWLSARPVTRLEFKNDLSIEITLAADGHDLYEAFCDTLAKTGQLPKDSLALAKMRHEFMQQAVPAIGTAPIAGQANAAPPHAARIPRQPPAWINQPLTSEATAKSQGSRLKTGRVAENAAVDLIRAKVDALELTPTTIGQAAKHDPAVERAVEQAMDRARAYKIEYLPDGSVAVKVSLDPRDLWDELQELP